MRTPSPAQPGRSTQPAQEAEELRAELDELLRARQYATQRERRLSEAVRQQDRPDEELLHRLAQARTLREGLGARCSELSEQLQSVEGRLRDLIPHQPTGARFAGTGYEPTAPAAPPQAAPPQLAPPPPATGARFGGVRQAPAEPAPQPHPLLPPQPAPAPPRRRSAAELTALASRIADLGRTGPAEEVNALLARAATRLAPSDVARLAGLLSPGGASRRLARAAAQGAPRQAARTLGELRQAGLTEEATELFHALWSYPAAALPALLAALEDAGQHADGATLLWEWGSAPTDRLAALAAGLHGSGRAEDVRTLLRQAAGRPAADLAELAAALPVPLAPMLIHELAALRPPAELARLAGALSSLTEPDSRRELYDELLTALAADAARHRTTYAALRSAGLPTAVSAPQRSWWNRR
ncbi:hypothetical protein ACWGB8_17980 [Kitasatospora sp. NPDC054939]